MHKHSSTVHHWKHQRLTALALVPLTLWFIISISANAQADYNQVYQWLTAPLTKILLTLFVLLSAYHAVLGLQVILEDYVHKSIRHRLSQLMKMIFMLSSLLALLAISQFSMELM